MGFQGQQWGYGQTRPPHPGGGVDTRLRAQWGGRVRAPRTHVVPSLSVSCLITLAARSHLLPQCYSA